LPFPAALPWRAFSVVALRNLRANFGGLEGRALRDGDKLLLGEQSDFARSLYRSFKGDAFLRGVRKLNGQAPREKAGSAALFAVSIGMDSTLQLITL